MKKLFCIIFLLIITGSLSVSGQFKSGKEEGGDTPGNPPDPPTKDAGDALASGEGFKGDFPPNTILQTPYNPISVNGEVSIKNGELSADSVKYNGMQAIGVVGFKATADGYTIPRAASLEQNGIKIINGEGIVFKNGEFIVERADSFVKDNSITTNINNLHVNTKFFSVKKADSFLSDCIRVDGILDSEFVVSSKVEITTKLYTNLKITDCAYNEVFFNGKGRVIVDKNRESPTYILENGTLTKVENGYNETVESNNSIIIETDKTFGFKCLTITPIGSYYYNDNDLRKDFIINVPKESSVYRLCIKKNKAQNFQNYSGLVDFPNKKIELNGTVNYLRYPLKNNQISSLLSDFVYRGLKDVNTILSYDNNLIFLNNIFLKNNNNTKKDILSITNPSNYLTIKEMEIDGEVHSVVTLNLNLKKENLNQNINYEYKTDYFEPKVSIVDNTLVQEYGEHTLKILPPGHKEIDKILKNGKK